MWSFTPYQLLIRVLPNKIRQGAVFKGLDRVTKTINKLSNVFTSTWVNTPLPADRIYAVIYIQVNTFLTYACCKFLIISFGLKEWKYTEFNSFPWKLSDISWWLISFKNGSVCLVTVLQNQPSLSCFTLAVDTIIKNKLVKVLEVYVCWLPGQCIYVFPWKLWCDTQTMTGLTMSFLFIQWVTDVWTNEWMAKLIS